MNTKEMTIIIGKRRMSLLCIALFSVMCVACSKDKKSGGEETGTDDDSSGSTDGDTSDTGDTGDTGDTDDTEDTSDTNDTSDTSDTGDTEETGTDSDTGEETESGIQVAASSARACDMVLSAQAGTTISEVIFADGVRGKTQKRPPKAAISFIATEDASFSGSVAEVTVAGPADAELPEILSATCYDKDGKKVAEAGATIE